MTGLGQKISCMSLLYHDEVDKAHTLVRVLDGCGDAGAAGAYFYGDRGMRMWNVAKTWNDEAWLVSAPPRAKETWVCASRPRTPARRGLGAAG